MYDELSFQNMKCIKGTESGNLLNNFGKENQHANHKINHSQVNSLRQRTPMMRFRNEFNRHY